MNSSSLQITGSSIAPRPAASLPNGSSDPEESIAQMADHHRAGEGCPALYDVPAAAAAATECDDVVLAESVSVHGQLLLLPTSCPAEYGLLVRDCVQADPAVRPDAAQVLQRLQKIAAEYAELAGMV